MSAAPTRRIVVVRHGQTVDNAAGIWQGHKDAELSHIGWRQAREAAPALAAYRPSLILSSDLRRASDTAGLVADLVGIPVRTDERLREVHVGEWQGLSAAAVREAYPHVIEDLDRGLDVPRGVTGETRADVAKRVGMAMADLAAVLPAGETALVVAHGVSGRMAACELVGMDQSVADQVFVGLDNCHWVEVVETVKSFSSVRQWRIRAWNVCGMPDQDGAGGTID